jgi:predicted nucleotidyltransferase
MILEDLYLKAHAIFGKERFSVRQFAEIKNLTHQSAKVLLHRMKKNGQVLSVKHGEYVLISPKSFLMLQQLQSDNIMLHQLASEIFKMFPELKALVLFGSHVRGEADRYSDYDAMLILPEIREKSMLTKRGIEKKLDIKLHLTVYSEKGYKSALLTEPHIRFWLSEGILFDESGVTKRPLPPVPKMAYEEWRSTAETYIETAQGTEEKSKKGRYFLTALEILELIKSTLEMNYHFSFVKERLVSIIGKEIMEKVRSGKQLENKELELMESACNNESDAIDAFLEEIGENEADIYWKKQLCGGIA